MLRCSDSISILYVVISNYNDIFDTIIHKTNTNGTTQYDIIYSAYITLDEVLYIAVFNWLYLLALQWFMCIRDVY